MKEHKEEEQHLSQPQQQWRYYMHLANRRRRYVNKHHHENRPMFTEKETLEKWKEAKKKTREQTEDVKDKKTGKMETVPKFRARKNPKEYYKYAYTILKRLLGI